MNKKVLLTHITTVPQSLMFLRGQVPYMRARDIDVMAISSPGSLLSDFGESEGVETFPVEMPRRISALGDVKALRKVVTILRRTRPAIVHAHTPKGGLLGMIAAALARVPVRIYHMRGLPYMTATGRRRTLLQATERVSCLLASRVFCVSHSIRDVAIQDGICPEHKIVVFGGGSGNGVDAVGRFNPDRISPDVAMSRRREYGIPEDAPVALFLGRIVRDKGVEELARAWRSVRKSCPGAWLIAAGPPEPQDPVSAGTVSFLENDSRVILPGSVSDPVPFYAMADMVVLPTYREGFPNVLLEAGAMKLPVVATRVPGCIDAVHDGVTGTLVPVKNEHALAHAMTKYLENPQLRTKHGNAGRKRVLEDFSQEVIWQSMYREYCDLLERKGITSLSSATA